MYKKIVELRYDQSEGVWEIKIFLKKPGNGIPKLICTISSPDEDSARMMFDQEISLLDNIVEIQP